MLLAIANQPVDNNTTFSTGGDVSRFQRRSVPRAPVVQAAPSMSNAAPAMTSSAGQGAPVAPGPSVRVARGNTVTLVPVGAR
jgi:pilus assembly protein CpaB